jgi:hypothetical protein
MKALNGNSKIEITSAVRCEIITSLATLVMVHTMNPTPTEYTTLSGRLVAKYPILADGFGCGYVSYLHVLDGVNHL